MKKNKIKIIITILCLTGIPVWVWLIAPVLNKLPEDFSFSADIVSIDNFYNEEIKAFSGNQYSKTKYKYDTVSVDSDSLVVKNIFDVRSPEDQPIFSVERLYGIDRNTGMHLGELGDKKRDGYLFAPRRLSKGESFTYWHINYDAPAKMTFVKEETLYGLRVFRYETYYEDTKIDQTVNLGFLPGVGKTRGVELEPHLELWIEPVTGSLIKYKDNTIAYYYDLQTQERLNPWNHFSNTFREESIEKNVNEVIWKKTKSQIFDIYIPIFLLLIGIFFVLKGSSVAMQFKKGANPNTVSTILSFFIVGFGLIVIVSWMVGIKEIIYFFSNQNGMNPLTAFCFIILGIAVLLKDVIGGRITRILGLILALIASLRILAFLHIISFNIDLVFFGGRLLEIPSRMGLYPALDFLFFGLIFIFINNLLIRRFRIVEILTGAVSIMSLLILLGYLFESFNILRKILFLDVAVHTAILFIISSIVVFIIFHKRDNTLLSFRNITILFGLVFSTTLIAVIVAGFVGNSFKNDVKNDFKSVAENTKVQIENRLHIYINALDGAKGFFSASQEVERDEWKIYVESISLQKNYPGIQGLTYVRLISAEEYDTHIAEVRAEGFPKYSILPKGERSLYAPVTFIEPFDERNQQAFGVDLLEEPVRRFGLEQARDTGNPKMTGIITLAQEIDADIQPGFIISMPLYAKNIPIKTIEERRKAILGYINAPFRARDFVESVIGKKGLEGIVFRIYDGTNISKQTELYNDLGKEIKSGVASKFSQTKTMYVAGRPWTLVFSSVPNFGDTPFFHFVPILIIMLGIGVGILLAFLFYALITSRQKAIVYANKVTDDLVVAKAKDEAIIASIGDGLAVADETGKLIYFNKPAEQILGVGTVGSTPDMWQKEYGVFDPINLEPLPAEQMPLLLAVQGKDVVKRELLIRNSIVPDGRFISVTATPIISGDKSVGGVAIFRDMTKEREVDKAKTEFVSLASHQLRAPLAAINWYIQMLVSGDAGKITDEQKKFFDEIYDGNQRMVEIVNTLLDVSRLELGKFLIEPKSINVSELAQSVINEQKSTIDERKINLKSQLASNLPIMQFDPKFLRMVFQNLLSNAVKYTPEKGSVEFVIEHIDKDQFIEGKRIDEDLLVIKISDTGYGIPKNQQDKIFTKLFRADNAREKSTEGTGLGLYIVKSVVDNSGGKIWFESEENKGTTFYVTFPMSGMKKKEKGD